MMLEKDEELKNLENICSSVLKEHGTLRTLVTAYDYSIQKQIIKCYEVGCERKSVFDIINFYNGVGLS